jgi:hypothetical protein
MYFNQTINYRDMYALMEAVVELVHRGVVQINGLAL